jgi:riboflavin synthase
VFTGIVEEVGSLRDVRIGVRGAEIQVRATAVLDGTKVGDSILTDGCCLTVRSLHADGFSADLQPETLRRTTFARRRPGARVNLERALTLQSRLGGHLVSGDVDGVGSITHVAREGNAVVIDIDVSAAVQELCAPQGRITVDGVGLTVVDVVAHGVRVSLIPHTLAATTLDEVVPGRRVNVEADLFARYVKAVLGGRASREGLTWEKLAESGFA